MQLFKQIKNAVSVIEMIKTDVNLPNLAQYIR